MSNHYSTSKGLHLNYSIITELVENGAKVLDLGCGDGELLKRLIDQKNVKGSGIEINQESVIKALEKGLSIIQGDIDEGLKQFPDKSYDYVILNQTLQSTYTPVYVLEEMLRVGKKCVVSFPNFAYWKVRFDLLFNGRMPKSSILPFEWYNTPNIHLLTIKDFYALADEMSMKIENAIFMNKARVKKSIEFTHYENFFAEEVIFVVSKG